MQKLFFILISILPFFPLRAQQVTNMKVTQEGDIVVITYNISSDKIGQPFDINVECSTDGGKTFSIKPISLTGDLKGIKAGTGKRIIWDVLSERQELTGDQFVFQLLAKVINPKNSFDGNSGIFTDARDGQVYKWVKIGSQTWMAENLKATKYINGTSIPNVTDNKVWTILTTSGYCWYNNDVASKSTYGALYNWHTVNTSKLAPKGWHVPTDAEWTILTDFLGGESIAGGKLKEIGTTHWFSPNMGANNETNFTALPGGYRYGDSTYSLMGDSGIWWSSTEFNTNNALCVILYSSNSDLGCSRSSGKRSAFSVRCVKD